MGIYRSLSARTLEKRRLKYALAAGSVVICSLLASAIIPYAGNESAYVWALAAVAFSAWYCGRGPSALAIALVAIESIFGFVPRLHRPIWPTTAESLRALAFLLCSVVILVLGEIRRRQHEIMVRAQDELESRVRERTADLDAVNHNLRELSARLMQLQDDERRRIARELHDSVGQMLAALSMNLAAVRDDVERLIKSAVALTDSETLVQDMSTEVRTISHLLHPPLLDEAGLSSALRWYVEGFAQRSHISVNLDLPSDFGRLPSELETAIFRVVQECLTNIHRHSGSSVANIRLRRREHEVLASIEDKGKGIPQEKQLEMANSGTLGVGIRGMRERLRQLGGAMEIESGSGGTVVTVRLPLAHEANNEPEVVKDETSTAAA